MASDEKPPRKPVSFEISEPLFEEMEKIWRREGFNDKAEFCRQAIREMVDKYKKKESGYGELPLD